MERLNSEERPAIESVHDTIQESVRAITVLSESLCTQYAAGSLSKREFERRMKESLDLVLETIDVARK